MCLCVHVQQREGERDGHRVTEGWVEALLSRCVNVISGGNGGRKVGNGGATYSWYLPSAWSRNTNTAPFDWDREKCRKRDVWWRMSCPTNFVANQDLIAQTAREKQTPGLIIPTKCFNNPKFPHSDRIPLWLSFTPVQLIGLILASVSLKAECICPTATPKGRKDNTSKPAAQLLADFKEILRDYVPLRCLSPVTAKVTRVTLTVVLFMLLDFLLLKLFGALLFAPHLLTTNMRTTSKHTPTHRRTQMMKYVYLCADTCIKQKKVQMQTLTQYTHSTFIQYMHIQSSFKFYRYLLLFHLFLHILISSFL